MNADRIRAALKQIQYANDEDRYIDGLLGRINPDDSVTYVPRGLANHKYVRIRNSSGAQSTVRARDDVGVAESRNLPVRIKATVIVRNSGVVTYAIVGLSRDESKATVPPGSGSGVPVHTHDERYYREAEFIVSSVGIADAGKPVKTGTDGYIDPSLLNLSFERPWNTDWSYRNSNRSSSAFAWKGNEFTPYVDVELLAIAYYGTLVASAVYQGGGHHGHGRCG